MRIVLSERSIMEKRVAAVACAYPDETEDGDDKEGRADYQARDGLSTYIREK